MFCVSSVGPCLVALRSVLPPDTMTKLMAAYYCTSSSSSSSSTDSWYQFQVWLLKCLGVSQDTVDETEVCYAIVQRAGGRGKGVEWGSS